MGSDELPPEWPDRERVRRRLPDRLREGIVPPLLGSEVSPVSRELELDFDRLRLGIFIGLQENVI